MAVNRYAKKVRQKNEAAENRAANALNDMTSYLSEGSAGGRDIEQISLSNIKINPANDYRELDREEDIRVLADDIERNGLLHNLVVSKRGPGEYVILSGERRYRALNLLMEKELKKQAAGDSDADVGKYRQVACKVIKNLTPRQERIILDAANLQTRGGAGSEKLTRMAMERYRDNVRDEYGLSDSEAKELLFKITNIGRSSLFRNFRIIDNLIPPFRNMLNEGEISKKEAEIILKLTTEQQIGANRAILAFKAVVGINEERYSKTLKQILRAIFKAAEAATRKEAEEILKKLAEDVAQLKPEKPRKPVNLKTAEKLSYRDNVLKECDDIQNKINRLKKRRPEKIREIDRAARRGESITAYIDSLINQLQTFRNAIVKEDKL